VQVLCGAGSERKIRGLEVAPVTTNPRFSEYSRASAYATQDLTDAVLFLLLSLRLRALEFLHLICLRVGCGVHRKNLLGVWSVSAHVEPPTTHCAHVLGCTVSKDGFKLQVTAVPVQEKLSGLER
jgi:hypothetical protein